MPLMNENELVNDQPEEKPIETEEVKEEVVQPESEVEETQENEESTEETGENEEETEGEPETFEVKFKDKTGKEIIKKLPLEELKKDYQLRQASYEKFQEASQLFNSATVALEEMKKDPISVHRQLCGDEATKTYLWDAFGGDPIETLSNVYGIDKIRPLVEKWHGALLQDEILRETNPQEWERQRQMRHQRQQLETEAQKVAREKREINEWRQKKDAEDADVKAQAQAKVLFTEIQAAAKSHRLDTNKNPKLIGIVAKYMEIYDSLEGRHISAEETVERMLEEFGTIGVAKLEALPDGEILDKAPGVASQVNKAQLKKVQTMRSTKPKKANAPKPTKKTKTAGTVYDAPWRQPIKD
jgi:hypothetical protein